MPTDSSSGGTVTTGSDVWCNWIDSTSTSDNETWGFWVSGTATGSGTVTYQDGNYYAGFPPETEEARQARQAQYDQNEKELAAQKLEKEAAKQKAEALLRESLDKEQREQFDKTKWFFVISQSGKRYRVRHGWIGNIEEINEKDMAVASYCIHPAVRVPVEDSMLIQKLMLEADEDRFVKIANKTPFLIPRALAV